MHGILFLASRRSLALPMYPTCFCGDSSSQGYAMLGSRVDTSDLEGVAKFREKWRFRQVEDLRPEAAILERQLGRRPNLQGAGQDRVQNLGSFWAPVFEEPDTQNVRQNEPQN